MLGFLLPVIMLCILYAVMTVNKEPLKVMRLLIGAYLVRMLLQAFVRDLPVFSYGSGGDCIFYEWASQHFARIWSLEGIHLLTAERYHIIGLAALPINLFTLIAYLNGDSSRAACTSLVAVWSVLACYQIYRMAVDLGADEERSFKIIAFMLFSPGYLYYTCDMYKDGLVVFLVVTALVAVMRLSRRVSAVQVLLAVFSLWALWYVRFYLVFLCLAPLVIGLLGLGSGSRLRQIFSVIGLILVMMIAMRSSAFNSFAGSAESTFNHASDASVRQSNQLGGSGVTFDDGGNPFGAIHLKVLYTLFSPFPWQGGSFALQMGKLDTVFWYYMFWRMFLAGKRLWRSDRSRLLMVLVFLVPLTLAYATTMANIGLILRQRLPIVFVGTMLAMLSWPARRVLTRARAPQPLPPRPAALGLPLRHRAL